MANQQPKKDFTDAELAEAMISRKFINPAKLKAALDYQASVGGRLPAVLMKLGLVREDVLREFLTKLLLGEGGGPGVAPDETSVDISKLRVHWKLLDKVPNELVDRFGILFFFPPKGERAILISSDPAVGDKGVKKLQELLGVDIRPISLSPDDRRRFLEGGSRRVKQEKGAAGTERRAPTRQVNGNQPDAGGPQLDEPREVEVEPLKVEPEELAAPPDPVDEPTAEHEPPEPEGESNKEQGPATEANDARSAESRPQGWEGSTRPKRALRRAQEPEDATLLKALIQLLVKKGIVTSDEIDVEIELRRRAEASKSQVARKIKTKMLVEESA